MSARSVAVLSAIMIAAGVQMGSAEDFAASFRAASLARREKVRSAWFVLRERSFHPKETWAPSFPAEDVTITRRVEIWIQGDQMRHVQNGKVPFVGGTPLENVLQEQEIVSVVTDSTYKNSTVWEGAEHPQGQISNSGYQQGMTMLKPLFMAIRMGSSRLGSVDPEDFAATGRAGVIDGASCQVLRDTKKPREIWVDGARGFCVRRYVIKQRETGEIVVQLDISYSEDETIGWMPTRWKLASFLAGKLRHQVDVTVSEYSLNEPIPAGTFDLQFAPGTFVFDTRGKPTSYFYQLEDSATRPVSRAEIQAGITYEQAQRGTGGLWWYVAAAVIAISGLALWFAARRKHEGPG